MREIRALTTWIAALGLALVPALAAAVEEAPHEVVARHDAFELRRHAPRLLAEVDVTGDFDEVGDEAFRVLFAYISGENRAREDIAMTAPVTQEPSPGEEIAMTAPVTQRPGTGGAASYAVAFVMPAQYTLETLPEPADPRIRIREVPGKLVAARRYRGFWRESRYREQETRLLEAIAAAGWEPIGAPVYARYDPPFWPWFLRRNEVWVEVRRP